MSLRVRLTSHSGHKALWLSLSLACSQETPPTSGPPVGDLCSRVAKVECDRIQACGYLTASFDRKACELVFDTVRCAPLISAAESAVARGTLRYDPVAAQKCLEAVGKLECVGSVRPTLFVEGCGEPFVGLAGAGTACGMSAECSGDGFCNLSGCPGSCVVPGKLGDQCAARQPCGDGLYCSTTGTCLESVGLGQRCELSLVGSPCVDGAYCDRSSGDPRCIEARGRGFPCTKDFECGKDLDCIRNLCSGGESGDTCERDADCEDKLICGARGQCAEPALAGDACEGHGACIVSHACTSSAGVERCLLMPGAMDSCRAGGVPCLLGNCVDETCVAAVEDGGPCATTEDCLPDRNCAAGRCAPYLPCSF